MCQRAAAAIRAPRINLGKMQLGMRLYSVLRTCTYCWNTLAEVVTAQTAATYSALAYSSVW